MAKILLGPICLNILEKITGGNATVAHYGKCHSECQNHKSPSQRWGYYQHPGRSNSAE